MKHLKSLFFFLVAVSLFLASSWTFFNFAYFASSQDVAHASLNTLYKTPGSDSFLYPALCNSVLMGLFLLQHTGMASEMWKNILADLKIFTLCRAIYTLMTSFTLQIIIYFWSPLPSHKALWFFDTSERPGLWLFFFLLHVLSWIVIYLSSLLMDQLDLIGIQQIYYDYLGYNDPVTYKRYQEQKLLKHMRHPGTTFLMIIFWIHPHMTLQRFFLALSMTLYLLFGFGVSNKDYEYVRHQVIHKSVIIKEVHVSKLS